MAPPGIKRNRPGIARFSRVPRARTARTCEREQRLPGRVEFLVSLVGHAGVRTPALGRGFVARNLVALQLASDLLEEPGCTVCKGSGPHITRFGIAAETSI